MSFKITDNAISVAALGPDGKQLAFSPNNHKVYIATVDPSKPCETWRVTMQLESAHSQPISGITWHHDTNRIITCAHDRTAFVWSFDAPSKAWTPSVVMLDAVMDKGCTCCAFVPSGERIILGSASKAVAVGKYSKSLQWWTCKFATPHTGSILCLAPHPTLDTVLATGSTDSTLRLLCIDTSNKIPDGQPTFGQELQRFDVGAWVHSASFLPSGDAVAACLHSSKIIIVSGDAPGNFTVTASVAATALPCCRIAALSDEAVIAAGFDFFPVKIAKSGSTWKLAAEGKQPKEAAAKLSGAAAARQMFQNEASTGQKTAIELPKTRHGNAITSVIPMPANLAPFAFMTTAVDGRAECWKDADLLATA